VSRTQSGAFALERVFFSIVVVALKAVRKTVLCLALGCKKK